MLGLRLRAQDSAVTAEFGQLRRELVVAGRNQRRGSQARRCPRSLDRPQFNPPVLGPALEAKQPDRTSPSAQRIESAQKPHLTVPTSRTRARKWRVRYGDTAPRDHLTTKRIEELGPAALHLHVPSLAGAPRVLRCVETTGLRHPLTDLPRCDMSSGRYTP